jgi:hypothetical protein
VLGTPAYMSPEQLEGEQVDGRSDLFSLGAILYSLLTGFSPFQGNSATTVCFKVANRDPVQVTALAPELPTELDAVISRALAKDPAQRYQRGIDFARDIQRLREQGGLPRQGPLWFSPAEGRGIWLEGATQRVTPRKSAGTSLAKAPSTRQQKNLPSRFTSSRPIAGPLISFFVATIVLSFFAWRQIRIATPAATTVVETSYQVNASAEEKPIRPAGSSQTRTDNGTLPPFPTSTPPDAEPESFSITTAATHKTAASVVSKVGYPAVPKTAPKSGNATGAVKVVPKSSEATTAVANSSFADSNVEVRIENHFSDGTLSIAIDDKLVYEHPLRDGHKKKLILLGGGVKEAVTLPVASGQHTVRVEVRSPKEQYDESRTVAGNFAKGGDKVLSITFEKHTREMQVTLGGDLTSHLNQ